MKSRAAFACLRNSSTTLGKHTCQKKLYQAWSFVFRQARGCKRNFKQYAILTQQEHGSHKFFHKTHSQTL
jgi:uncharacterized membrane protein YbaN (DUF454 family)